MGNSQIHIKFIKLRSRKGRTFFNIVLTHKKIFRKAKILHPSSVTFGCNCPRIQPGSGSSLIGLKKTKDVFRSFPPTNGECTTGKLVGLQPGKSILIYAWIEKLSMWNSQAAVVVSTQHPLRPTLKILSQKMLHIAHRCFWMLPFATLSDLETAAISGGFALQSPDGTRTGTFSSCQWRDP